MSVLMMKVMRRYEHDGYVHVRTWEGEYVLMANHETGEKVRIYFDGRLQEYR